MNVGRWAAGSSAFTDSWVATLTSDHGAAVGKNTNQ